MNIKGSTSDPRQVTKGGSLRKGRSHPSEGRAAPSDNDPSSLLQRIVFDLFQRQRATEPPTHNGAAKLHGTNGHGRNEAVLNGCEIAVAEPPCRVPGWKYMLDASIIAVLLPLWLPVMLLMMLVTRLSSPGPIFYRQERIGLGGQRFLMWKFRTMKMGSETLSHESYLEDLIRTNKRMTKLDNCGDPRLVPFGRILRATGLDELPQIFNVLRSEMSLVGPRPCLPNEFANYQPWQRRRVDGLPGLTGYWQVNGKNKTTFNQMVAMDLSYLENMSIGLDLKIILMTGGAILTQLFESRE